MEDKAWGEVVERLARIETKLDNYEALRDKAEQAYLMAKSNAEDIREIEANSKWAWGFIITISLSFISYFITRQF